MYMHENIHKHLDIRHVKFIFREMNWQTYVKGTLEFKDCVYIRMLYYCIGLNL